MGAARYLARSELRHRRSSLAVLVVGGLLVTLVVVTALTGSRRTDSALARMRAHTQAADATVQIDDLDGLPEAFDAVVDLPIVTAAAPWQMFPTFPLESSGEEDFDFVVIAGLTDDLGRTVDRPRLLTGRMPVPGAADEVVLNEIASEQMGLGVGDRFTIATFSTDDVEVLFGSGFAEFPGFNGPEIDLVVTGVGRWVDDLQGDSTQRNPQGLASPAFLPAHPEVGGFPPLLQVRLADGASVSQLRSEVRALLGPGAELSVSGWEAVYGASLRSALDVLATTLLVIMAVAGGVGAVLLSQVSARHLAASRESLQRLSELGLARRAVAGSGAAAPAAALALGIVLGASASVLASPLLPIGVARRAEPDPGLVVDLVAIGAGTGLVLLAALGGLAVHAWRSAGPGPGSSPVRASSTAELATRLGAGPAAVNGVRFAFGASGRADAVPARTAITGVALAVTGLVATAVVVMSISTVHGSPERYGWTWSAKPDFESDEDIRALAGEDRLAAATIIHNRAVLLGDEEVRGFALEDLRGATSLALRDGRAPVGPAEVALGARTMDALDVTIGDTVDVTDRQGAVRPMEIVGEVLLPRDDNPEPGEGAMLTLEGLDAVATSEGFTFLVVRYPAGADPTEVERALAQDHPLNFSAYSRPLPPGSLANLAEARSAIASLGAFFVVLGALAIVHALLTSTRRHARDVAVLRTIGFVRRQVRFLLSWQGAVVASAGLVVGLPAGLIVGRAAWRLMSGDLGLLDAPTDPWALMAVAAPALVAAALLIALAPARTMAATPAHTLLRTE
jgi:hypothetical protein